MRALGTRVFTSAIAGFVAVLLFAATANAGSFVTQLGGVNVDAYCKRTGYTGAKETDASITGWACFVNTNLGEIDVPIVSMDVPCAQQYARASLAGFTVTAGCNTTVSVRENLGGIATDAYCESLGFPSADIASHDITGWRCRTSSGPEPILDMDAACRWQYGAVAPPSLWTVFSVWGSFGDVFGISCIAIQLPTPDTGGGGGGVGRDPCPRC